MYRCPAISSRLFAVEVSQQFIRQRLEELRPEFDPALIEADRARFLSLRRQRTDLCNGFVAPA